MELTILTKEDLLGVVLQIEALQTLLEGLTKVESRKEWLSEKEAMKYLEVSKSTIQRYRKEGLLDFSQYQNKIYFKREDLLSFLESNYTGAITQAKAKERW